MPTQTDKRATGRVYKMISDSDGVSEFYVGSTIVPLYMRFHLHKSIAKTKPHIKVYKYFNEAGWQGVQLIQLAEYPDITRTELAVKEREWVQQLRPSLNVRVPSRTRQEWYVDNRERILQEHKEYYRANREHAKERQRKWYNANKERMVAYCKQYYVDNKEKMTEYNRQYRNKKKANQQPT